MTKRRIVDILACIILCAALVGCGKQNTPDFTFSYLRNSRIELVSEQAAWDQSKKLDSVKYRTTITLR